MALGIDSVQGPQAAAPSGTGVHLQRAVLLAGTTLTADLSGLGTATARTVSRSIDGGVGVVMSAVGDLSSEMRGYVYDALIGSAYGRDANSERGLVQQLIDGSGALTRGREQFSNAGSGALVPVNLPPR